MSDLVRNPDDQFSHNEAHLFSVRGLCIFPGSPHSVSHVTYGDAGNYICTLTNGPGSSITKTFHVTVNGKLKMFMI